MSVGAGGWALWLLFATLAGDGAEASPARADLRGEIRRALGAELARRDELAPLLEPIASRCLGAWDACLVEHIAAAIEDRARGAETAAPELPYLPLLRRELARLDDRSRDGPAASEEIARRMLDWFSSLALASRYRSVRVPRGPRAALAPTTVPRVTVDARVELVCLVHFLGRLDEFGPEASAYARKARRRFERYRTHPVVAAYAEAFHYGDENLNEAVRLAVKHEAPPSFKLRAAMAPLHWREEDPEQFRRLEVFLAQLSAFASESRFMEFFKHNRPFYDRVARSVDAELAGRDYGRFFDEYAGLRLGVDYQLILAALVPPGADVLSSVGYDEGAARVVTVASAVRLSGDMPVFDAWDLSWTIWHELAHAAFERELDRYPEIVSALEARAPPPPHFGTWQRAIREHVAMGVADRVWHWARETGRETRGSAPDRDLSQIAHLPLFGAIGEALRGYETERTRYPDLRAFYPRLLELFGR